MKFRLITSGLAVFLPLVSTHSGYCGDFVEKTRKDLYGPRKNYAEPCKSDEREMAVGALAKDVLKATNSCRSAYHDVCSKKSSSQRVFGIMDPAPETYTSELKQHLIRLGKKWDQLPDSEKGLDPTGKISRTTSEGRYAAKEYLREHQPMVERKLAEVKKIYQNVIETSHALHANADYSFMGIDKTNIADMIDLYKKTPSLLLDSTMVFDTSDVIIGGELLLSPNSNENLFAFILSHEHAHAVIGSARMRHAMGMEDGPNYEPVFNCLKAQFCTGPKAKGNPEDGCAEEVFGDWLGAEIYSAYLKKSHQPMNNIFSAFGHFCGYGGHSQGGHPDGNFRMNLILSNPAFSSEVCGGIPPIDLNCSRAAAIETK